MSGDPVNVIVAGITRSGLTATCQMLAAGGMLVTGEYPAYEPYTLGGVPWGTINGQVVKLVDSHWHFPPKGTYAVIRLKRDLQQQYRSLVKFGGLFTDVKPNRKQIMRSLKRDYQVIDEWAKKQRKMIVVEFERIIEHPRVVASELSNFLGVDLNVDAAAAVVMNRSTDCHAEVLEFHMTRSH